MQVHIYFYSKKYLYRKKDNMIIMREENIQINNNIVESIQIITCPTCGFTFRLIDVKNRNERYICPLCGCMLSGLDFSKFMFIDKDIFFHRVK